MNLMQVNTQAFLDFGPWMHTTWAGPLEIVLAFVVLWFFIGWGALAGFGTLLIITPYSLFLSAKYNNSEQINLQTKDKRIKMMNEILNGMKVNGGEKSCAEKSYYLILSRCFCAQT
jgi:ATP-binding cassette subfamily C (CFTR/MRP) protein 1